MAELRQQDPNYAITRIDLPSAGTYGFQVRLQRRGIKYGKFFADRIHGQPKNALQAARDWRDALLEEVRAFPAVRHAPATRHVHERDTSIRHLFSEDKGAHGGSRKPVEVDYRSGSIRFEVAVDVVDPAGGL